MRRSLGLFAAALLIGLTILVSPFVLEIIIGAKPGDWTTLGNIGQAYGAPSALLAGFALLAIAASMTLQAREHAANRAQVVRNQQFELLRAIQQHPELLGPIIGHDVARDGPDRSRQLLHAAMWISWGKTAYMLHEIPQVALRRELFPGLFSNEIGRERWRRARGIMRTHYTKGRAREFFTIGDEEYEKAINSGAELLTFPESSRSKVRPIIFATVTAMAVGLVTGYRLRR